MPRLPSQLSDMCLGRDCFAWASGLTDIRPNQGLVEIPCHAEINPRFQEVGKLFVLRSAVPSGLGLGGAFPSVETLGYCLSHLRALARVYGFTDCSNSRGASVSIFVC